MALITKEFNEMKINVYGTPEIPYFRAKEIATILGYSDTKRAIKEYVDEKDRIAHSELVSKGVIIYPLENVHPEASFINESGLYSLVLGSRKPFAKKFKRWITNEVLPSIRKTGTYTIPTNDQFNKIIVQTEKDLHQKVVEFIRKKFPNCLFSVGLHNDLDTKEKRIDAWKLGYTSGMVDLTIMEPCNKYAGYAIEFKTPTGKGVVSDKQKAILDRLVSRKYKVLVSNDYDEIILSIYDYLKNKKTMI